MNTATKRCREKCPSHKTARCERDRYHGGYHRIQHPLVMAKIEWRVVTRLEERITPYRRPEEGR